MERARRILVVEDEIIVAENLRLRLNDMGYAVPAVVISGEAAILKAKETEPDLVLMDIQLKGEMDGIEAAEQIHTRYKIPIVYLTAYADQETLDRAKVSEPFGYMIKPFEATELYTTIEMALYKDQLEKALKESEEKYRRIIKQQGEGIISLDSHQGFSFSNPAAEEIFGVPSGKLVGRNLGEFTSQDLFHCIRRKMGQARPGQKSSCELEIVRDDGKHRQLFATVTPWQDCDGSFMGAFVIFRDDTERKRSQDALQQAHDELELRVRERTAELAKANQELRSEIAERGAVEAALKNSEERYRMIFDGSRDAIFITGEDGGLVDVNKAAEELSGYSKEELLAMKLDQLRDDPEGFDYKDVFQRTRAGEAIIAEWLVGRKDGSTVFTEFARKGFSIEEKPYMHNVGRDATERWMAKKALLESHDDLERRVVNRTAELERVNKELRNEIAERRRAETRLKVSLEEKEVLLKEIHHRVKNNLQVVSSLLYLQSEYIKDPQSLEILKESRDRVRTMALVHERLYRSEDLARIDFQEYIHSLVAYLFSSYKVNPALIRLKLKVEDLTISIDRAIPCGLIITELISNSLKHAFPEGKGTITVEFQSTEEEFLTLVVRDDGVGFSSEMDFRNTESMGLRLVTTLTRQLDGEIELDQDGGTSFTITFQSSN